MCNIIIIILLLLSAISITLIKNKSMLIYAYILIHDHVAKILCSSNVFANILKIKINYKDSYKKIIQNIDFYNISKN